MKHSAKSKLLSVIMAGMMATSIGAVSASAASLPQIQLQAPQGITVLQDTSSKAKTNLQALKDSAPKLSTQFDKTPILFQTQDDLSGLFYIPKTGYDKKSVATSKRKLNNGYTTVTQYILDGKKLTTKTIGTKKLKNGDTQFYIWGNEKKNGKTKSTVTLGTPSKPITQKKGQTLGDALHDSFHKK